MVLSRPRVVLDTNVVFEGLTKQGGACGSIIDAWFIGTIDVCICNALAYEYVAVLSTKLGPTKWKRAKGALRTLLEKAEFATIHYSWRPASPDAADDMVIDCVMNANAMLVTANVKDFREAVLELGIYLFTPDEFMRLLLANGGS